MKFSREFNLDFFNFAHTNLSKFEFQTVLGTSFSLGCLQPISLKSAGKSTLYFRTKG